MRCQHNHHRPRVKKGQVFGRLWFATCACGWRRGRFDWHEALALALAHSEELTS